MMIIYYIIYLHKNKYNSQNVFIFRFCTRCLKTYKSTKHTNHFPEQINVYVFDLNHIGYCSEINSVSKTQRNAKCGEQRNAIEGRPSVCRCDAGVHKPIIKNHHTQQNSASHVNASDAFRNVRFKMGVDILWRVSCERGEWNRYG